MVCMIESIRSTFIAPGIQPIKQPIKNKSFPYIFRINRLESSTFIMGENTKQKDSRNHRKYLNDLQVLMGGLHILTYCYGSPNLYIYLDVCLYVWTSIIDVQTVN